MEEAKKLTSLFDRSSLNTFSVSSNIVNSPVFLGLIGLVMSGRNSLNYQNHDHILYGEKAAYLLTISIDCCWLIHQSLNNKITATPPSFGKNTWTISIKDTIHYNIEPYMTMIIEEQVSLHSQFSSSRIFHIL